MIVGVPVWVYKWAYMSGHIKESGTFYLWYPQDYFGVYPTWADPGDDDGIIEMMERILPEKAHKSTGEVSGDLGGYQELRDLQDEKATKAQARRQHRWA
jgi:hypothetical protein